LTKNTIHIFFILIAILIIGISIKHTVVIPMIIGILVLIQGIYGFLQK